MKGLRHALRGTEPLDFLMVVSGMLEATDLRSRDPFGHGEEPASREDLVESFIETSYAETTAALTAMSAMIADEVMAARIGRELTKRHQPIPQWLTVLDRARVHPDVRVTTHVLGDADTYLLGVALPSGHSMSALLLVDHNLGGVVKDAFVVPQTPGDLADLLATTVTDPDQSMRLVDSAVARAVIDEAIEQGAHVYPPLETDTWPMCRPVVEWMVRMLPGAGVAPERPEWAEADLRAVVEEFFQSSFATGLDGRDQRELMDSVLWFGTDYGPGDPLRWSPVNVEWLLADWFPRKIIAEPAFLTLLPDLLRAFIRYCHHVRGIRPALTAETLAAVDACEPAYQRVIRSARLQGPAALLAGLPTATDDEGDLSFEEIMLEGLDRTVGSRLQLMALDDVPLPDEAFEWAGVAADLRAVVQEMLDACDRVAADLLDIEHRTAMRRFLSRAAVGDPAAFRRGASPLRGAAAVAWVICRANGTVGGDASSLSVAELLAGFGVSGSVSQRAAPLLRANGVDPHRLYGAMYLGAPDLLTSQTRILILARRDRYLGE